MKDFRYDFYKFLGMIKRREPFSFARYSDGQMFVLQNKPLMLKDGVTKIGNQISSNNFRPEDRKDFDPVKHQFFSKKLMQAYTHKQHNYFKGLSCRCCVGQQNFDWMHNIVKDDEQHLTWANLFVNRNYPMFVQQMVSQFKNYDVYFVCNQRANLTQMPFDIKSNFRVGFNCMFNNYDLVNQLDTYIEYKKISGRLFLFSASTLSNFLAYQLFKNHPQNTYMDIGTTLNPYMKMSLQRSYLKSYWQGGHGDVGKVCIW